MTHQDDTVCRTVLVFANQVYEAADEAGRYPDGNRGAPADRRVGGECGAGERRLQTAEQPRNRNCKEAGVEDQVHHAGLVAEDEGQKAARQAHRQRAQGWSSENEDEDDGNDTRRAHVVQFSGRPG